MIPPTTTTAAAAAASSVQLPPFTQQKQIAERAPMTTTTTPPPTTAAAAAASSVRFDLLKAAAAAWECRAFILLSKTLATVDPALHVIPLPCCFRSPFAVVHSQPSAAAAAADVHSFLSRRTSSSPTVVRIVPDAPGQDTNRQGAESSRLVVGVVVWRK
jgi:hypothetical protein